MNELDPINLAALANPQGKPNEVGQMCVSAHVGSFLCPLAPGETGLLAWRGSPVELTTE